MVKLKENITNIQEVETIVTKGDSKKIQKINTGIVRAIKNII